MITYDDLVADVRTLPCALQRLYPEAPLPTLDDFPEGFKLYRDAVLVRGKTSEYREIEAIVRECLDPSA